MHTVYIVFILPDVGFYRRKLEYLHKRFLISQGTRIQNKTQITKKVRIFDI